MPFEVNITGIDGSGKTTAISHLSNIMSKDYVVAHCGMPSYIIGPGMDEKKYLFESNIKFVETLYEKGTDLESKAAIALANIVYLAMWCKRQKKITEDYSPDIIFSDRNRIIDSAVYSSYYLPLAGRLPQKMRTSIAEVITRSKQPDLLVYLDITTETAIKRIKAKREKESEMTGLVKQNWRDMHETPEDLSWLKDEYEQILKQYKHSGWNIHIVDVEDTSQDEVADRIDKLIRDAMVRL